MLLMAVYLAASITGITLMKMGAAAPLQIGIENKVFSISVGGITLLGLLCYIVSFLLYTRLVATYDISYLVPMASAITQVIVVGIALIFFKEQLTTLKIIGLCLSVLGVLLMNIKS